MKLSKTIILLLTTILFLFCQSLTAFSKADRKVLPPDKILNRKAPVLSNTVLVRLKPGYDKNALSSFLTGEKASRVISLLAPEKSMTYNIDLRYKINNITSEKQEKIIRAEEPLLRTFRI